VKNVVHLAPNGFHMSMKNECLRMNKSILFCVFRGKRDRQDVYQAPYVWVQFLNPKPNVLINVLCRAYGQNIDFDKKTGRALTRFQLFVDDASNKRSSRQIDL